MTCDVAVIAPAPLLTITIELCADQPDVHLHAGGQGFWVARMATALGVPVTLCASFGGETGAVIRTLIEREGVDLNPVDVTTNNIAYVHDRRSGERQSIAEMGQSSMSRHDIDEFYGAALATALAAKVCVLTATLDPNVMPPDTYRRLSSDLRANGTFVVADLSGEMMRAAVEGGVDLLKVSDEELERDGLASSREPEHVLDAMHALRDEGVPVVVVSRAGQPAFVLWDERVMEVVTPQIEPFDERGAGDSMTAGMAAGVAMSKDIEDWLRLGAAAGTLNTARRGLATGRRSDIEMLAERVDVRQYVSGGRG